ncbi:MAG: 23S rRNA (guanosine(2251)-2'-O)-methyltransferase RlmB [Anaerolineae bacterium]|nr:MAG: 23S rRNA (guanosine(2251)-2'-O)-methyltransferase RlmB [Anaerolineae bacterium]
MEWILGRNPVYEVLRAGRRRVIRLRLAEGVDRKRNLGRALRLAEKRAIPLEVVSRRELDRLGENHQGVALQVGPYPYADLLAMLERAAEQGEPPFLLLLDSVQDPHNLGALLRTAEAVGVHGVLLPLRHTATVTPAVVSTSSGASEHLLIGQANLAQAITTLKRENVWVYGLDIGQEAEPIETVDLKGALALVVGNEAGGLRALVRKACDGLIRLPMRGRVDSLNAAVAGSVALYFAWSARGFSGCMQKM